MNSSAETISRLENKTTVIGIMGMGYVSSPLAIRLDEVGYKVPVFDIVAAKVERLNEGVSLIEHGPDHASPRAGELEFEATTDFTRVGEGDALIRWVLTPPNKYRYPDLSFVLHTTESLMPHMRPGQVMSLKSATYLGTTDEELVPSVGGTGFVVDCAARAGALRSRGHHG